MAIKTNVQALNASNQLKQMSAASETAARKVASGQRIGVAADDVAGMAISEKMQNNARGLTQAVRNVKDANAFFNIADGALQEADDMIKRIHEISIQAANDTLTDEDRKLLTTEVTELVAAIDDVAYHTEYGKNKIFAPEDKANANILKQFYVQAGANEDNGNVFEWNGFDAELLTLKDARVDPHSEALTTIDKCKYALSYLSEIRTTMGVYTNRLDFSEHIADTNRLNITDANSRIKDADIAREMMNYTKSNVLQQAAINMTTMSNQSPQRVLELLKA